MMFCGIRLLSRRCGGAYEPLSTRNLLSTCNNIRPITNAYNSKANYRYLLTLPWSTKMGDNEYRRCINTYSHLPSSSRKKQKRPSNEKKKKKQRGRQSYRFVDRTRVQVSGGTGGRGGMSMFHVGRKRKRRPDGGHGGNGGSILILADPHVQSLRWTRPHVTAEAGTSGGSQGKHGRNGKNTILRVPCGVVVRRVLEYDENYDSETKTVRTLSIPANNIDSTLLNSNEEDNNDDVSYELGERKKFNSLEVSNRKAGGYLASNDFDSDDDDDYDGCYNYDDDDNDNALYHHIDNTDEMKSDMVAFTAWGEKEKVEIADLDKPGSHVVVVKGGRGGYGNSTFSSTNGPLPPNEVIAQCAEPDLGESCRIELELKLIADIGLVGFPNAGKSSLLSATSRATPHIAPYPFTTLNPLVGYIEYRDGFRVCVADVPGLIAGASEGKGKGHDFLRHLERTKVLLYIVDAAGIDGRKPVTDFETLVQELSAYEDGDMLNRRCLVVANKIDLLLKDEREMIFTSLQNKAKEVGIRLETNVIGISAGATGEGLPLLTSAIRDIVTSTEEEKLAA